MSCLGRLVRLGEWVLYLTALGLGGAAVVVGILLVLYGRDLPSLEPLASYNSTSGKDARWSQSTQVIAADGSVIGEFYEEDRVIVGIDQIPLVMRQAIIAVEDERFDPAHPTAWIRRAGIDPIGIARAAVVNLLAGQTVQGGSTITQQLAKNLFLTHERTVRRKIQEMMLAYRIEQRFSRDEIMERYLNKVFFGNHAYGIHSAASRYYGIDLSKPGANLSIGQAAMLAGLVKAPSAYAPHRNRSQAEARLKVVLQRMAECGYIRPDSVQAEYARFWNSFDASRVTIPDEDTSSGQVRARHARFFVEYIKQELLRTMSADELNRGGYRIETTLDPRMQAAAEAAMSAGLARLTQELTARRVSLAKGPLEGALVAIDHRTGRILAMVGGSSWSSENQFNRAVQARRQPGSSFKPIVYWTALDQHKATLGSVLWDQAFQVPGTNWIPKNYDGSQRGPVLPRTALTHSLNIAAVRMLLMTSPEEVIAQSQSKLGINTVAMRPYPSIALGAFEVTLLEMVSAYSAFANQGQRCTPGAIVRILDKDGRVVRTFTGPGGEFASQKVMEPGVAFLMTSILQSVVQRGTAASTVGARLGSRIPAAGKTGTTDDYADAWFIGFTPSVCAGVWVGFDERRTMGRGMTGGRAAGTIWADFIARAFAGKDPGSFPAPPPDVIPVTICSLSGLRASPDCPNPISEYFIDRTAPGEICNIHSDPAALEAFLYGDAASENTGGEVRWPDYPSIGFDTGITASSRERLRAILDAEAPPPDPVPAQP